MRFTFLSSFLPVIVALVLLSGCEQSGYQQTSIKTSIATPLQIPPVTSQTNNPQDNREVDYVVVQKMHRVVTLWKKGRIVKTYPILAMGAAQVGHKAYEGDERTPEGLYYIDDKHPSQNFQKFLKISYPNEQDKSYAKKLGIPAGGNVGLHGDRGGFSGFMQRFKRDWTDGCIAMRNADIEDIYEKVEVGTPILIKP